VCCWAVVVERTICDAAIRRKKQQFRMAVHAIQQLSVTGDEKKRN